MSRKHRTIASGMLVLVAVLLVLVTGCQNTDSKPAAAQPAAASPAAAAASPAAQTGGQTAAQPVAAAPNVFQLGKVRGVSAVDKQALPGGKLAITLTKGAHDSEKIVTSGVNNVGVGSYVFLEGRSEDAKDVKIKSWSWEVSAPDGTKVTVDKASTKEASFVTSQLGEYKVKVATTNEKGEPASSDFKVYAGRYVGSSLCMSCHNGTVAQDIASKFTATGHATKVETTYASYSKDSDYCIRCHVTGYDESANNGGFDDLAKAAGWDSAKDGSVVAWMKAKNMTVEDLKKDPNLSVLMNIQCESCHGPGGSQHTGSLSWDVGVCAQCHSAQPAGWQYSAHGKELSAEFREGESCVECHTAQGFVAVKVDGKPVVFPSKATKDKPATLPAPGEMVGQTCVTCHDPHVATNPEKSGDTTKSKQLRMEGAINTPAGVKVEAGVSAVCVSCHANKRDTAYQADYLAGKKARGAHGNSQSDVFYGFGAFDYGKPFDSSMHNKLVKDGCVACHMAANPIENNGPDGKPGTKDDAKVQSVGNHSFSVQNEWKAQDKPQATKVENIGVCTTCHAGLDTFNRKANGDYDGNGKVEGIQTEVDGLLKLVEAKLPKDDKGVLLSSTIDAKNTTEIQRKALWDYALVNSDGSKGVHNTAYSVQVLQQTYKALAGVDVPGATIR